MSASAMTARSQRARLSLRRGPTLAAPASVDNTGDSLRGSRTGTCCRLSPLTTGWTTAPRFADHDLPLSAHDGWTAHGRRATHFLLHDSVGDTFSRGGLGEPYRRRHWRPYFMIPHTHGPIPAPARYEPRIEQREIETDHKFLMMIERLHHLTHLHVPKFHGHVVRRRTWRGPPS